MAKEACQSGSGVGSQEKPPTISLRRSKAARIWLAVVGSVLVVLFWQTRHPASTNYNLFLSGDSVAVGAEVWIDGQKAGQMEPSPGFGLSGAVFYAHLPNGHHRLEVRKPGFKRFRQEIEMKTEDYVSVELSPERKDGEDDDTEGQEG